MPDTEPSLTISAKAEGAPGSAIDPVCGMTVEIATARHSHEHGGRTYYFCAPTCRTRFAADPIRYLDPKPRRARRGRTEGAAERHKIHLPDGPRDRADGPGTCPKCGMALEPMGVPPADAGPNPELVDFQRRLKVGAALTVPLAAIAMAPHVGIPLHDWLSPAPVAMDRAAAGDARRALVRLAHP